MLWQTKAAVATGDLIVLWRTNAPKRLGFLTGSGGQAGLLPAVRL